MSELYADVLIDSLPLADPKPYTYRVPLEFAGELKPGTAVVVPFGPRPRVGAYVVAFPADPPQGKAREIREVLGEGIVPEGLRRVLSWVADYYGSSLAQVWGMALPRGTLSRKAEKTRLVVRATGGLATLSERQNEVLSVLSAAGGSMGLGELVKAASTSPGLIRTLESRGAVVLDSERVWRSPSLPEVSGDSPLLLNEAQREAVRRIVEGRPGETFLLHGVTGSGKTEVYLQAIARTLEEGQQAIVLVPEIALTPQTVARFRARFGDRIAVLHSALGEGERFDEWQRLRDGDALVAIGARSAVFAPVPHLGLLIIDEEHEGSYKQESPPRYHARQVALARAEIEGARVVLGSATPSIESYYRTEEGEWSRLELPDRVGGRPLPPVRVVDMREELADGNRSLFSRALVRAIDDRLERGEQIILLMNRRGYNTFVFCRSCGEAVRCPHCAVSLTAHKPEQGMSLRCHYCDHTAPCPSRCPGCKSPYIKYFGAGTQQVVEALQERWPEIRSIRMDRDTTGTKDAHRRLLDAFTRKEAEVLIGTQMIAKGLDLPNVSLVGVLAADATLHMPDFRAAERTFQLLTQVAGRAGRGDRPGEVVIQTYSPDHMAVHHASKHDYLRFYAEELRERQDLRYPPFVQLINLVLSDPDRDAVWNAAGTLAQALEQQAIGMVLGPAEAAVAMLRGRYRVQILLKTEDIARARNGIRESLRRFRLNVRVSVDVDPLNLM